MRFSHTPHLQISAHMPEHTLADTSLLSRRVAPGSSPTRLSVGIPLYTDCRTVLRIHFHSALGSPDLTRRFAAPSPSPATSSSVPPTPRYSPPHRPDDASNVFYPARAYSSYFHNRSFVSAHKTSLIAPPAAAIDPLFVPRAQSDSLANLRGCTHVLALPLSPDEHLCH